MNLTQIRTSLGITQEEMAKELKVSKRTYQRWESGQKHCPPGALKLAEMIAKEKSNVLSDSLCTEPSFKPFNS